MSMQYSNRVFLPNGNTIYVSDDQHGDARLQELYETYGNLKLEACERIWGKTLQELKPVWSGTIEEFYL